MEKHELLYGSMVGYEQKKILNTTGCQPPCKFTEFSLEKESVYKNNITDKRNLFFGFYFATTDLVVKTERLVYPPTSFLAEVGGALGLFLGFSFFSIGDTSIWMLKTFKMIK